MEIMLPLTAGPLTCLKKGTRSSKFRTCNRVYLQPNMQVKSELAKVKFHRDATMSLLSQLPI